MEDYFNKFHREDIHRALKNSSCLLEISLTNLSNFNASLYQSLINSYDIEFEKWKISLKSIEKEIIKNENLSVPEDKRVELKFFNSPILCWPDVSRHLWKLIEMRGHVFRMSTAVKRDLIAEVKCKMCKGCGLLEADRIFNYTFKKGSRCLKSKDCTGRMDFLEKNNDNEPNLNYTIEYQELKLQELDNITPKRHYFDVETIEKQVKKCEIGDDVRILGILEPRFDRRSIVKKFVIRAISIEKESLNLKFFMQPSEIDSLKKQWQDDIKKNGNDIAVRDEMLKFVAPDIHGCFTLKLAILLTLCSGGQESENERESYSQLASIIKKREICHLLLVGAPGIGKSQLMIGASNISTNPVHCCGYSASGIGLTAHFYRDTDGENQIEAGALVLANNGVCCIDEFNFLSAQHRASIHEVMEHQKISLMKASLKCDVYTYCSIIGTMNHKPSALYSDKCNTQSLFKLEPSLVSRFDLLFLIEKPDDEDYDMRVVGYILDSVCTESKAELSTWTLERLRFHVIRAKTTKVEITKNVTDLISRYFNFCLACDGVDDSRKTFRLLDSLRRLTIAHSKMMLQNKTRIIDALTAIWLNEQSWSFGYLVEPINPLTSELPIGPTHNIAIDILEKLHLPEFISTLNEEQNINEVKGEVEREEEPKVEHEEERKVEREIEREKEPKVEHEDEHEEEHKVEHEEERKVDREDTFTFLKVSSVFDLGSDNEIENMENELLNLPIENDAKDVLKEEELPIKSTNFATEESNLRKKSLQKSFSDSSENQAPKKVKMTDEKENESLVLDDEIERDLFNLAEALSGDNSKNNSIFHAPDEKLTKTKMTLDAKLSVTEKTNSLGSLKQFEYQSQESNYNIQKNLSKQFSCSSGYDSKMSEDSSFNKSSSQVRSKMTHEEYLKALDDEFEDLENF